jgi:2-hydroxy fatty acid dioxygenase
VFWIFIFSNYMAQTAPANFGVSSWVIALPIHVAAWIAQFIGHGVYERRRPALLDSLDQALITAPMFVLLEVLFSFGYRKDLYDRVMTQVRINVLAYHGKEAFEQIFGEKIPLVGTAA